MSTVTMDGAKQREMLIDVLVYRAIVNASQDYYEVITEKELGRYSVLGLKILQGQIERILENKYNLKCVGQIKLEIDDKIQALANEEVRSTLINNLLLLPDPNCERGELTSSIFNILGKIDSKRDRFKRG